MQNSQVEEGSCVFSSNSDRWKCARKETEFLEISANIGGQQQSQLRHGSHSRDGTIRIESEAATEFRMEERREIGTEIRIFKKKYTSNRCG